MFFLPGGSFVWMNLFCYFRWGSKDEMTLVQFRRVFSGFLINNPYISGAYGEAGDQDDGLDTNCDVVHAPPHAREYRNRKWTCDAKHRNQQYTCKVKGCSTKVRSCCACSLGYWMCTTHIVKHAINKSHGRD